MKKFYTLAILAAMTLAASAQQLEVRDYAPMMELTPATTSISAPQKATSLDGTVAWGYYDGTALTSNGNISSVGYGSSGEYWVGVSVPANETLKGTQIQGINAPIYNTSVMSGNYAVEIYDGSTIIASKSVAKSILTANSLNTIMLDDPVTIDKDLVVCTHFTTTGSTDAACYPILFDTSVLADGSLMLGDGTGAWTDYGAQFGAYALQVFVSGIQMADANATFNTIENYTAKDTDNSFNYTITSNGGKNVENIEYTISVAGDAAETRTANVSIASGFNKTATIAVPFHSPAEAGDYTVDLAITKVNGVDNSKADVVSTSTFHNVNRLVERNVVMEEFTGTGCGYCPRGWVGMSHANEKYGDRFIGIALHQYNSTDPMYIASASYPLSFSGAPSCMLDRATGEIDPWYGSSYNGINDDIDYRLGTVATVEATATASFTDDTNKKVKVDATVDAVSAGTYEVVFVLTADGLTGSSFNQSNYYYQYSASQADASDDELLAKFCSGGEWGKSSVNLTFDDVAIATSYLTSKNKGGSITLGVDEKGELSYTLTMPTKTALLTAIKNTNYNVYANVLVLNADGTIGNACRVKVNPYDAEGIQNVAADSAATEVGRYTLDGRRAGANAQGVTIIRMSDGTAKKVIK